ncbi:MAG: cytochrome c oxidase subunit 3 [Caulobacterales bacterium]|nr:cytochrome c oxidase subunit 3 [Caulobacterales bacterium]
MKARVVGDVSMLPDGAFGSRTPIWWGLICFILIEGGGFALACGAYFFLMSHTEPWPPSRFPPDLPAGIAFTALLLLSEIPNVFTKRAEKAQDERATQLGLIAASFVGALLLAIRWFEFHSLNVRWDDNAYGSIVWALLFLHTVHLITDWADTVVLAVFTFTHEVDTNRFSDVADNSLYWHFVVIAWLPIYALIYWVPRLAG